MNKGPFFNNDHTVDAFFFALKIILCLTFSELRFEAKKIEFESG